MPEGGQIPATFGNSDVPEPTVCGKSGGSGAGIQRSGNKSYHDDSEGKAGLRDGSRKGQYGESGKNSGNFQNIRE